ncbi:MULTISPECIES: hypothetical protein [unclassified Virgibacillus]|uniref:hypothetical protein n=1 Tax=unclassified Virgibacillus TaxID=2620237 RepID=UPI0024DE32F3|nr:hypothetical protein [Virgibacillus sp. LDC-1]
MQCPNCQSKDLGKIGSQQFYCWSCYIEIAIVGTALTVHQVEVDGSLSSLDDLFSDEERQVQ